MDQLPEKDFFELANVQSPEKLLQPIDQSPVKDFFELANDFEAEQPEQPEQENEEVFVLETEVQSRKGPKSRPIREKDVTVAFS